ncbi:cbb3-type cytochrome c oxidase subunit I [Coraliomargarita akajimensis]|uniref:Cytochrome-c oxidase n=1 Tax=Coraliomargarita akajimensis (strain DSM 45221 / IAM 15411 / JCM 23193 / KCTC 12865 / 04OKA010-24) TaxID=583355 RepID=D5EKH3_CORAD|nr:cbb3-type cytochrome c oxidase subunit I [Coraliomargarita akajimensis]ADE53054.1 Cytochrome-c oxidase [Coraliomargarita akajimensis DSM 45221]
MSDASKSISQEVSPYSSKDATERAELSEIDASIRTASIFFTVSAVLWLMIGTIFALIAAFKMHQPDFVSATEFTTFGRMRSAHLNAMALGWGNNIIFAVCLWIMARLCRSPIRHGGLLLIAGAFWNVGLTVGIAGIIKGDITSVEWLEIPRYASPLLAISYILVGIWGIMAFHFRKGEHVYVSQWYFLGALFWFPWLYVVAQLMIIWVPAQGVVQSVTNWWFAHNVLGLWLTPMALGTAYYLIPKVLGRPIYSYYLSVLGFWSLALFYNWAGVHHLIGGPVPVWLVSAGIVASVMMVIPVVVVGINHHMSIVGFHKEGWRSPTIRFVVFGAINYTFVSLIGSAMALRDVNLVTHFTHFTVGHAHHGAYAFFAMIMFGGVYYMMPRMLKREWPSATLIQIHFWGSGLGILVMVFALQIGGWIQGLEMNNAEISFLETVQNTMPWLKARSISGLMIMVGHIAFAINFFWMLFAAGSVRAKIGPTLLKPNGEEGAA